jgi:hypothetical protein
MAEAGDGNIKVVVRCRPLNSRGTLLTHTTSFGRILIHLPRFFSSFSSCESTMQSSHGAPNHSSGCKATRRSWTRLRLGPPRTRSEPRRGKQWRSASTRVIGLLDLATSRGIVHSRRCTTTSERNCWTMGLRGLMRVFWLVSGSGFVYGHLSWELSVACAIRWSDW